MMTMSNEHPGKRKLTIESMELKTGFQETQEQQIDSQNKVDDFLGTTDPQLQERIEECRRLKSTLPLTKQIVKYKILERRAQKGLGEIDTTYEGEKYLPLTKEEEEKRKKRREQNKKAAARCRDKRKIKDKILTREFSEELAKYSLLNENLRKLEAEKIDLTQKLFEHEKFCPMLMNLEHKEPQLQKDLSPTGIQRNFLNENKIFFKTKPNEFPSNLDFPLWKIQNNFSRKSFEETLPFSFDSSNNSSIEPCDQPRLSLIPLSPTNITNENIPLENISSSSSSSSSETVLFSSEQFFDSSSSSLHSSSLSTFPSSISSPSSPFSSLSYPNIPSTPSFTLPPNSPAPSDSFLDHLPTPVSFPNTSLTLSPSDGVLQNTCLVPDPTLSYTPAPLYSSCLPYKTPSINSPSIYFQTPSLSASQNLFSPLLQDSYFSSNSSASTLREGHWVTDPESCPFPHPSPIQDLLDTDILIQNFQPDDNITKCRNFIKNFEG